MDRRAAIVVLVASLIAVLFAAVATAGEVRLVDGPPTFFDSAEPGQRTTPPSPTDIAKVDVVEDREARQVSPLFEQIAQLLGWAALVIAGIVTAVFLWRTRPYLRRLRRRRGDDRPLGALADVATSITNSASAQRAALTRGRPRNAIVECWLLLEAAVMRAGVVRSPSDTTAELVERVLREHDVDAAAITQLAALYREARFSDHEMDETARNAAIDALADVHLSLADSRRPGARPAHQTVESA